MKLIKLTLLATATFLTTSAPTQANIFSAFGRGSKNAMGVLSNDQNKAAVNGCSLDAATGLAREYCTLRETPTDSCFISIKKQIEGYIQKEGAKFFTRTSPLILDGTSPKDAYGQCFGTARDMILKGTTPVDGAFFNSLNPEYSRAPGNKFNIVAHQRAAQAAELAREEGRREALASRSSGLGDGLVLGGQETCPDVTALQQELEAKTILLDQMAQKLEATRKDADQALNLADEATRKAEEAQANGGSDPDGEQKAVELVQEGTRPLAEKLEKLETVLEAAISSNSLPLAPVAQPQAAAVSAPAAAPVAPTQPAVDVNAAARAEQERLAAEQARLAAEQAAEAERQAEAQRKAEAERAAAEQAAREQAEREAAEAARNNSRKKNKL